MISKNIVPISTLLLFLLSVYFILDIHASVHAQIYMGTSDIPFIIPNIIAGVLITLIGSTIIQDWGIEGFLITQIFLQLIFNFWYPIYLNLKLLQWKLKYYVYDIFCALKTIKR